LDFLVFLNIFEEKQIIQINFFNLKFLAAVVGS